jgi:uncharacterized membrane protein HdeD (DUF308 family)
MPSMNGPSTSSDLSFFGQLRHTWKWMLGLGILAIVLGVIGLAATMVVTIASIVLFGILLVVGGFFQGVQAYQCRGWQGTSFHVVTSALYLFAGLAVLIDPVLASRLLTLLLAGFILAAGVLRSMLAVQMRGERGWGWLLAGGGVAIALGLLIMAQWPTSALWVIGLFIAIELLVHGISLVYIALAARGVLRDFEEGVNPDAGHPPHDLGHPTW